MLGRFYRSTWFGSLKCYRNYFFSSFLVSTLPTFRNQLYYHSLCSGYFKFSYILLSIKKALFNKNIMHYSTKSNLKCWKCNKNLEIIKFSCLNCGALQYPDPQMTYFQLLDLPITFDLTGGDISDKYKNLQKIFHPDKFVRKSKEETDISDSYSRLINTAYSTLKDPLSRGLYILSLNGISTDDSSVKMSKEFLLDVLENNEKLENINDENSLRKLHENNIKVITGYISHASKAFQANDLQEAREVLMKMKYFVNLENEIKKKKSAMGIVDE